MYKKENRTLPINSIEPEKYKKLEIIKKKNGLKSINEVVRIAIDRLIFQTFGTNT
ncbi:MAG: hypothetical protein WC389_18995 [Lutibacter sp.]|jgi:hypothetical protein